LLFIIVYYIFIFVFFFSSRRRHTRFSRDWSSDVCSSDLINHKLLLMKSLHIFKKLVVITVLGLILVACGGQQDQVNSNITAMFGSLRGFVGKATNITLRS